jgi:hypothetical protein
MNAHDFVELTARALGSWWNRCLDLPDPRPRLRSSRSPGLIEARLHSFGSSAFAAPLAEGERPSRPQRLSQRRMTGEES